MNLLENATKYTPEGTPIELVAEASDDAVILEIRDRGPGFAPGEEKRIFDKFYRGRSEGARGAGPGTRDLPGDDRSPPGHHRSVQSRRRRSRLPDSHPLREPCMKALILIVEDDPQIRRFLRATLTAEGYLYHEALTAEEGIQQVNARRPDLILLDLGSARPRRAGRDSPGPRIEARRPSWSFRARAGKRQDRRAGPRRRRLCREAFRSRRTAGADPRRAAPVGRRGVPEGPRCASAASRSISTSAWSASPARKCTSRPTNTGCCRYC